MKNERNLRFFRLFAYLRFLTASTNQHGIHSPFVYALVTRCFYNREKHPAYDLLTQHRKKWFEILQESTKAFSDSEEGTIWRMDGKEARLLNRMVRYLKCRRILQLSGPSGYKTAALSLMNSVEILNVLPNSDAVALSQKFIHSSGQVQVRLVASALEDKLQELASKDPPDPFDLIFLDGSINPTQILQIFDLLLPLVHNDTAVVVEGIHRSPEMEKVWDELCMRTQVRVSIDIFRWGLIFFRREQAKEHFVVRI